MNNSLKYIIDNQQKEEGKIKRKNLKKKIAEKKIRNQD